MARIVIKDTSRAQKRIDPDAVARVLGAKKTNVKIDTKRSPISLYSLRLFLFDALRSSGKQPCLAETRRISKRITLPSEVWGRLETLVTDLREREGITVSSAEVAAALIHLALSKIDLRKPNARGVSKKNRRSKFP